jgi:hypothetical protein
MVRDTPQRDARVERREAINRVHEKAQGEIERVDGNTIDNQSSNKPK